MVLVLADGYMSLSMEETNNPSSFTAEYGDNLGQFRTSFVSCSQLELSGQVGDIVKVNAELFGRDVEAIPAFSDSTIGAPQALEAIKMGTAQFFIANDWAGINAATPTELKATLVDFNWRFMTGFSPMKFADNRLTFTELAEAKRHVELEMTVGFNNDTAGGGTVGWFPLFRDQTERVLELRFDGIGGQQLRLQQSGKFTEYGTLTEREGQDIVKVKFVSELLSVDPICLTQLLTEI